MIPTDWYGMLPVNGDIVVVEDDDIVRALLIDVLCDIPAEAVFFGTADEAFEHVLDSHRHCSLLITDHGVPGRLNGSQLAIIFRAKWPDVAIILTSGYEIDPQTLPSGVVYLQKPWSGQRLIQSVAELLQPGLPVGQR